MSIGPAPSESTVTVRSALPRRAVIDRAWRAIGDGVEVLSADDGGPLRRTVKRILDPLVLRLRSNAPFSAPVLAPEVASAMHALIVAHGPQLRATADWFVMLKAERRRLRITTGNAQELYFPVCYELAVTKGIPREVDHLTAAEVLHDLHRGRDRTAIEVLNRHLENSDVVARLAKLRDRSWRDVRPAAASRAHSSPVWPPCSAPPAATVKLLRASGSGRH
ncbi:Uncharacterised protein [Mycobacteroides abscessus]|nr:Uncharacterised protein [Mycobacteroides abscessus]